MEQNQKIFNTDGLMNLGEHQYNIKSEYTPAQKDIISPNRTLSIKITYIPSGIYWNGTIPSNDDTDPINPDTDGDGSYTAEVLKRESDILSSQRKGRVQSG